MAVIFVKYVYLILISTLDEKFRNHFRQWEYNAAVIRKFGSRIW